MRHLRHRLPRLRWAFGISLSLWLVATGCSPSTHPGTGPHDAGAPGAEDDLASGPGPIYDLAGHVAPSDDLHFDPDAYWAVDPPVMYCHIDGGVFTPPKPPGGTPECPDDKNREGCECPVEGMTASCWPGLRQNRGLGSCHDGTTTCQKAGETQLAWGPCMGYQLPDPNATTGKDTCRCFSAGQWKIDNLTPCIYGYQGMPSGSGGVASSYWNGNVVTCDPQMGMLMPPAKPWANDTITADCQGHFKLCYALRAGDGQKPMPGDCTLAKVCTEGDYTQVNQAQPFPPLPAFAAGDAAAIACAEQFAATGGYGEMSVDGETITCDQFSRVFNRVVYCPLTCNQTPNDPKCQNCQQGGGGTF